MSYVLKLCGWYPSENDVFSGDFVQRHAQSIATQIPVVAVFATKEANRRTGGIRMEKTIVGQLEEYRFYYPCSWWFDKVISQWYYLKVIKRFIPALLREKGEPAAMHVNIAWKAAIWAGYLRRRFDWPMVVTENSTEYQPGALFNIRNQNRWRQRLTAQLFQNSRSFISVSEQLAKVVQQLYGPLSWTVVPNAVNTNLFFPVEKAVREKFRIIHISTLTHQKNPEGLLQVFGQLLDRSPDLEIEILAPDTALLKQWLQSSVHSNRIIFTGLVPYHQVAQRLQQADLLVLFSRYENLPCVILEALCCGVPVVSTDVGGVPEVISEANGKLVGNEDEKGLLNAILEVKENYHQYDREAIAEEACTQFNFETIGKQFLTAYQKAGISFPTRIVETTKES
ncbi:MAG TPA: glycosyltransferase family 4 protein [Phnomibacter sp.]|nr:glycosyltransferase family 4 protein [Phnomibacter sp.]